jgi:hypothetical protein
MTRADRATRQPARPEAAMAARGIPAPLGVAAPSGSWPGSRRWNSGQAVRRAGRRRREPARGCRGRAATGHRRAALPRRPAAKRNLRGLPLAPCRSRARPGGARQSSRAERTRCRHRSDRVGARPRPPRAVSCRPLLVRSESPIAPRAARSGWPPRVRPAVSRPVVSCPPADSRGGAVPVEAPTRGQQIRSPLQTARSAASRGHRARAGQAHRGTRTCGMPSRA